MSVKCAKRSRNISAPNRMMKVGDQFTRDFVVTDEIYAAFTNGFKDRNDLHVNDAYAQSKGYQQKVMHGNILGGFLSYFIGEGLPVRNTVIMEQSIKYRNPFYLSDTITLSAVLEEVYESVSAYIFKFTFTRTGKTIASGRIQIGLLA